MVDVMSLMEVALASLHLLSRSCQRPWLPIANVTSAAHVNYVPFSWPCLGERKPMRAGAGRDLKS